RLPLLRFLLRWLLRRLLVFPRLLRLVVRLGFKPDGDGLAGCRLARVRSRGGERAQLPFEGFDPGAELLDLARPGGRRAWGGRGGRNFEGLESDRKPRVAGQHRAGAEQDQGRPQDGGAAAQPGTQRSAHGARSSRTRTNRTVPSRGATSRDMEQKGKGPS